MKRLLVLIVLTSAMTAVAQNANTVLYVYSCPLGIPPLPQNCKLVPLPNPVPPSVIPGNLTVQGKLIALEIATSGNTPSALTLGSSKIYFDAQGFMACVKPDGTSCLPRATTTLGATP